MRRSFKVSIDMPPSATVEEARQYIAYAVAVWKGSLFPGDFDDPEPDPMYELDGDTVKVVPIPVTRKKPKVR